MAKEKTKIPLEIEVVEEVVVVEVDNTAEEILAEIVRQNESQPGHKSRDFSS